MISYSQNREDVLLHRVFRDSPAGFYVDVGAAHPHLDSVTRWFYDQGWQGINIEPRADMYRLLCKNRPRDCNLNLGVSNQRGTLQFSEINVRKVTGDAGGLSTFDTEFAMQQRQQGQIVCEREVAVRTLSEILAEHHPGEISFLKIDVEGHEYQVIAGTDFNRYRPRVILVEATLPLTDIPCHSNWEPILTAANYLYATFDGLNRYYVRVEDQAFVERLQTPVNVLDGYVSDSVLQLQLEVAQLRRDLKRARRFALGHRTLRMFVDASRWFSRRPAA